MKDWYHFYRNGFACALYYDEGGDTYFGYIGFPEGHPFYGSLFKRVKGKSMGHYNLSFDNDLYKNYWWMGFSEQTTYDKAVDRLKDLVDSLPAS